MFRVVWAVWFLSAAVVWAATGDGTTVTPTLSAPLRSLPDTMPKKQASDQSIQLRGADSELTVALPSDSASSPSVFDDLAPQNNIGTQKAQILLKRNLLDDVSLSYKNNVGLANATPTANHSVTAQNAQNQSSTDLKWNVKDNWSVTASNQMDQIFEFQRADPTRTRNGIETRYQAAPGTALGLGTNSENYYTSNAVSFERQTTAGQFQQKLGSLPLNWTANPALIRENSLTDITQNRDGSRLDQSLLWNVDSNLSWNLGTGWTDWSYDTDSHRQFDRSVYSQWSREIRKNYKLTLRTDLETTESISDTTTTTQREDKFKLSVGQQLNLADDLSAAFDLRQEYQRDINSTWSPSDHSATLSIQKKF